MDLSTIVQINISLATVSPSRASFGVPLLMAHHTRNVDLFRDYTSLAGMISDGFTVNDQAYKLAAAVFGQRPRPPIVRVARLPTPATNWIAELDLVGMVAGQRCQFVFVDSVGATRTVDVAFVTSPTATATAAAAAAADARITAATTRVVFNSGTPGVRGYVRGITGYGAYRDITADWAYDTALTACLNANPGFYAVAIDVDSDANITDVAAWARTNSRIFGASPQYTDPAGYATVASALRTGDNDRAFSLITRDDPEAHPAAGWLGGVLARDPGKATAAYKPVRGLTPDAWTAANLTTLNTNNTNYYVEVNSVSLTYPGKMHGGEWIDVTRDVDWLEARMAERLLALQVNNDKVPFTNVGISMIGNEVRGQLAEAVAAGVIDANWTVTLPDVLSVPSADRTARNLTGVEFEARLAGAVHTVVINGRITA
jgi:hypothetical protein